MQSANTQQQSFYQTLARTGIDYYFAGTSQVLQSSRPVVCAACLVILEDDPKHLSPSQHKILEGMLKVLDLKRDEFCVAWRASVDHVPLGEKDLMEQAILKYAPYSVLFLGSVIASAATLATKLEERSCNQSSEKITTIITHTYSPQELETDPSHKRAAFDTLLHLKAQIQALCTSTSA